MCKLTSDGAGGVVDVTACGDERFVDAACVVAAIRASGGLQLTGAKIAGQLCLDFETLSGPLALLNCEFEGFQAVNATFKNVVKLNHSSFTDLDFLGSVFERVLLLDEVTVRGPLSLWSTRLQSGLAARGLTVHGRVRAREMSVASSADFSCARFSRGVTFERAHVGQSLFLRRTRFASRVSFNGADAAHIDARGSWFAHDVAVRGTRIAGTLRLDHARFRGATDFDECQVRDITARSVRFDGLVTFRSAGVSAQVTIENAAFGGGLHIEGLHAGGLVLARTKFAGSLVAKNLDVGGDATFAGLDLGGDVEMTGGRFGNALLFSDVGCRSMDLSGAAVAGRLRFRGRTRKGWIGPHAQRLDVFKLENVTVGQDAAIRVRVEGNVKLRGLSVQGWLDLRGLRIHGTGPPQNPSDPRTSASLHAQYLNVGRDLDVDRSTRIAGELDLTGLKAGGSLRLPTSTLPAVVLLSGATLGALELIESPAALPARQAAADVRITMSNCAYGQLVGDRDWLLSRLPTRPKAAWSLRAYIESLRQRLVQRRPRDTGIPDRQPFLALERVLRTNGRDKEADEVYFAGRSRTRRQSPVWQWWPQSIVSGYGVKAWRTAACVGAFWLLAFAFFATTSGDVRTLPAPQKIDPQTKKLYTTEGWTHHCGDNNRATWPQALHIPLQILLPSAFADPDLAIVTSCPVTLEATAPYRPTFPPIVVGFVIFVLKVGGLIVVPLGIAMVSGLLRPAARA